MMMELFSSMSLAIKLVSILPTLRFNFRFSNHNKSFIMKLLDFFMSKFVSLNWCLFFTFIIIVSLLILLSHHISIFWFVFAFSVWIVSSRFVRISLSFWFLFFLFFILLSNWLSLLN